METKDEVKINKEIAIALSEIKYLSETLERLEQASNKDKQEILNKIKELENQINKKIDNQSKKIDSQSNDIHCLKDKEANKALEELKEINRKDEERKKYYFRVVACVVLTALTTFLLSSIYNNFINVSAYENGYNQAITDINKKKES